MKRRDFLKALLGVPVMLYVGNAEAESMKLFNNKSPEISYFGRWREGYTGFGATYIRARFTGAKIGAILNSPGIWWRAHIDNGEGRKFTADGEVMLAENLEDKEHEILLVRSSEGEAGIAYFGGFLLENNAKLIKAPRKKHTLEFIGDSITAGYMNDGKLGADNNRNKICDNDASYGPNLARMIGAEYSVIAKSGMGVAVNYSEKPPYNSPHAADIYNWTFFSNSFKDNNIEWDASKFPVEATFVEYGTNDFAIPEYQPDEKTFKREYKRIIKNIRAKNGNIPIICLHIISNQKVAIAAKYISETVKELNASGDKNIYYIEVNDKKPLLNHDDYIGDDTHPTKAGSKKVAEFLLPKVKNILKW